MGFISNLFAKRSVDVLDDKWYMPLFGLWKETKAGIKVDEMAAMQSTAVFACIRVLAETNATVPFVFYERVAKGKERAQNHNLYEILHDLPNSEITADTFRKTLEAHRNLWGNAYAYIVRDGAGKIRELWPLVPWRMKVERVNGELVYKFDAPNGQPFEFNRYQILHIPGMSFNGITGFSPIQMEMEAVGFDLALREFGSRFFSNGTNLGGIVKLPGKLSEPAKERLKESVKQKYQGLGKSHLLMILEEGMEYEKIGIPPGDAQFLETRKFSAEDIARIYRVPQHMIGLLDRSTNNNIEQQAREFIQFTMLPHFVAWEKAVYKDLLLPSERKKYFAEFMLDFLMRGDYEARMRGYAVGRQWGWLSANDIRRLENMNEIENGSVYLTPLNMVSADKISEGGDLLVKQTGAQSGSDEGDAGKKTG